MVKRKNNIFFLLDKEKKSNDKDISFQSFCSNIQANEYKTLYDIQH